MCHSDDSRPPGPPHPGEVAEHGPLVLTAEDGAQSAAYLARPAEPNGINVVLLPDRRGKHPFYDALAQRFAEAGFTAIAFDYFGRTAGAGPRNFFDVAFAEWRAACADAWQRVLDFTQRHR